MKYALKQITLATLLAACAGLNGVDLSSVNKFEVVTELQDLARTTVALGVSLPESVKGELTGFSNRNLNKCNLTLQARQAIMDYMSTQLFNDAIQCPFRIPSSSLGLSQMDAYLILMAELIEDIAAVDSQYKQLRDAFCNCIRVEALYKLSNQLNKPQYHAMMPEQMRAKFGASKFANMTTLGLLFSKRVRCKESRAVTVQAPTPVQVIAPAQTILNPQQPAITVVHNLEQNKQKSFLSYLSWTNLSSLWKRIVLAKVYAMFSKMRAFTV